MEFKELVQFIKQNFVAMSAVALVFVIIGVGLYVLVPARYLASGSMFISRQVETSPDKYFSYEGYYSQQTAQSYAGTFLALVESTDVKSSALTFVGKEVNANTLLKLSKSVKIKKEGPQLISLTITTWDKSEAEKTWKALTDSAISFSHDLNKNGDPYLQVAKVNDTPIVRAEYKNVFINIVVGYGMGMVASGLFLALRKYLA